MITYIVDNFGGRLTRQLIGSMNSGLAKYNTTYGNDPFSKPGSLTWVEGATRIDPNGTVITDLIMAAKERVESGISYVYAIGHLGRLYKIQVNDPTTYNPNFDTPVLLATLALGSPTFTRGASLDFYGASEKIYIGHDKGVTSIHFDGSAETVVGLLASWTQNVPRLSNQFLGKMYFGNGSNIAEIDSTETVTSYTRLSPGFPTNTQVRDIDLSPAGTYLEMVVSRLALPDLTATTQDTTFSSNTESYIFKWNGTDGGYTSFDSFPSFSLNANTMFGAHQYTFGYDIAGAAIFNPTQKILSPILSQAPLPNAIGSNGNLIGWATIEFSQGFMRMVNFIYGSLDNEVGLGWWRQFAAAATGTETDVIRVPVHLLVSNLVIGSSSNGYAGGVSGTGKAYFSTLETSSAPTTKYKFYKWFPVPTGQGSAIGGVYETQNLTSIYLSREVYNGKLTCSDVRIYTEPLVTGNSFQIDLIGDDYTPIANTTKIFTVGTGATAAGDDRVAYNPGMAPTHSLGVRVTNLGAKNWVLNKIEMDISEAGS